VIALTIHADPRLTAALRRAGAAAFVLKESAGELPTAIRTVVAGQPS
jgi:DNA-binding NarL/FixJ family response regulator